MKVTPNDLGICGVSQWMYAGTIKYNTTGASTGVKLCELPHDCLITRAVAVVKTAFDAGTSNELTVGTTTTNANELLGSDDITEGTTGAYGKDRFIEAAARTPIVAKYTQTGTDATAGEAEVYLEVVGIPEIIS